MKMEYYIDSTPSLQEYQKLLAKMDDLSSKYSAVNEMLKRKYSPDLFASFEKEKTGIIDRMMQFVLDAFPALKSTPCAIYLNGSYARGSITAGSDLDILFLFERNKVESYQGQIYLIRNAIARVFGVSVVHIHSFMKNFTTESRKNDGSSIMDQELTAVVKWRNTGETFSVEYPSNQSMAEREVCEFLSVKDWDSFCETMRMKMNSTTAEWMYSFRKVYSNTDKFDAEAYIDQLEQHDNKYIMNNLSRSNRKLLADVHDNMCYMNGLDGNKTVQLAEFCSYGKRRVLSAVHNLLAQYRRGQRAFSNELYPNGSLRIHRYLRAIARDSRVGKIIANIGEKYDLYRYLLSRHEVALLKNNHHFEHRSKEVIEKENLVHEYCICWETVENELSLLIHTAKEILQGVEFVLILLSKTYRKTEFSFKQRKAYRCKVLWQDKRSEALKGWTRSLSHRVYV